MSYASELKKYLKGLAVEDGAPKAALCGGLALEAFGGGAQNRRRASEEKERALYLRGIFIAAGTMADPKNQYYVAFSDKAAGLAKDALSACGITPLCGTRKGGPVVYLRESDAISDFLTVIGASRYALAFMEIGVINSMKREANRKNNAELANLDKTAVASAEIRRAIKEIIRNKKYKNLPEPLKETARLRLEYPSLTLDELRMMHEKPISKSGLYHRLKKIAALSLKYRR